MFRCTFGCQILLSWCFPSLNFQYISISKFLFYPYSCNLSSIKFHIFLLFLYALFYFRGNTCFPHMEKNDRKLNYGYIFYHKLILGRYLSTFPHRYPQSHRCLALGTCPNFFCFCKMISSLIHISTKFICSCRLGIVSIPSQKIGSLRGNIPCLGWAYFQNPLELTPFRGQARGLLRFVRR